jgi:hypothetical protein
MEPKYVVGDMVYNRRDNTYNLILDITETASVYPRAKYLYRYLDLGLDMTRTEFIGFFEERTVKVA